jgi:hypothetical protein
MMAEEGPPSSEEEYQLVPTTSGHVQLLTPSVASELNRSVDIEGSLAPSPRTKMSSLVRTSTINTNEVEVPDYLLLRLGRCATTPLPLVIFAMFVSLNLVPLEVILYNIVATMLSTAGKNPRAVELARVCGVLLASEFFLYIFLLWHIRPALLAGGALDKQRHSSGDIAVDQMRDRRISKPMRRWLDRWHLALSAVVIWTAYDGLEYLTLPLLDPLCESQTCNVLWSGGNATNPNWRTQSPIPIWQCVTVGLVELLCWCLMMFPYVMSTIVGSVLASDAVDDATQALKHFPPSATIDEWLSDIEQPVLVAAESMAQLSNCWGPALPFLLAIYFGLLPISCVLFSQIFFTSWVSIFTSWVSIYIVQCMFVVVAVFHAFTISSTHCTALMDELNKYRLRSFAVDSPDRDKIVQRLSDLETALNKSNHGAGMGFVVLGLRMSPGTIKALGAAGLALVPLPSLLFDLEGSPAGDVCFPTPFQTSSIQAAMSASDPACVYNNVTLQSILSLSP